MSFQDKSIRGADCGQESNFTAGEQGFYSSRGLRNEPNRCPQCRRTRKAQRSGSGGDDYTSSY